MQLLCVGLAIAGVHRGWGWLLRLRRCWDSRKRQRPCIALLHRPSLTIRFCAQLLDVCDVVKQKPVFFFSFCSECNGLLFFKSAIRSLTMQRSPQGTQVLEQGLNKSSFIMLRFHTGEQRKCQTGFWAVFHNEGDPEQAPPENEWVCTETVLSAPDFWDYPYLSPLEIPALVGCSPP